MTDDKVLEAAEAVLVEASKITPTWCPPKRIDPARRFSGAYFAEIDARPLISHLAYCVEQIEIFLQEGRREKAMRWLGFMQGCAFMAGAATINELGRMNMPTGETELRGGK